jgi:ADP-heptose:LPS heptosyltransferase
MQFIRYASSVKRRGGQVMLLCPGRLLRLLARCEGVDMAFDASSYDPDCHIQVPMLSVPVALMTQLDLVISPDTAVAHLARGLGQRVWVGLWSVGDWRYPHGRNDTPWYPIMRHFRQSTLGEWDGAFAQMKSALEELLAKPAAAE